MIKIDLMNQHQESEAQNTGGDTESPEDTITQETQISKPNSHQLSNEIDLTCGEQEGFKGLVPPSKQRTAQRNAPDSILGALGSPGSSCQAYTAQGVGREEAEGPEEIPPNRVSQQDPPGINIYNYSPRRLTKRNLQVRKRHCRVTPPEIDGQQGITSPNPSRKKRTPSITQNLKSPHINQSENF